MYLDPGLRRDDVSCVDGDRSIPNVTPTEVGV